MPAGAISFPRGDEFEQENQLIIARHPLLLGAFGSVDGLALPAQTAEDPEVENATYNSWKASHFISNVLAFSLQGQFSCDDDDVEDIDVSCLGTIISAVLNAPGSWHDSHVACPLYEQLRT